MADCSVWSLIYLRVSLLGKSCPYSHTHAICIVDPPRHAQGRIFWHTTLSSIRFAIHDLFFISLRFSNEPQPEPRQAPQVTHPCRDPCTQRLKRCRRAAFDSPLRVGNPPGTPRRRLDEDYWLPVGFRCQPRPDLSGTKG